MAVLSGLQGLGDLPAMVPLPGVVPDFAGGTDLTPGYIMVLSLSLTISTLAVCMRSWTKYHVLRQVGREDYACLIAYGLFVGYWAVILKIVIWGVGRHQWNVPLKSLPTFLYDLRVVSIIYGLVVFAIKLSVFLQYLRIFVPNKQRNWMFWICHIMIWMNLIFYLIATFVLIFICRPISKAWDPLMTTGSCLDVFTVFIVTNVINAISDILVLVLPQPIIWALNTSFKKKLGVSGIFLIGIFACISSIVRTYYTVRIPQSSDITYHVGLMGPWTFAEFTAGFLVACLPVLPKFLQSFGGEKRTLRLGSSLQSILRVIKMCSTRRKSGYPLDDKDDLQLKNDFQRIPPADSSAESNGSEKLPKPEKMHFHAMEPFHARAECPRIGSFGILRSTHFVITESKSLSDIV